MKCVGFYKRRRSDGELVASVKICDFIKSVQWLQKNNPAELGFTEIFFLFNDGNFHRYCGYRNGNFYSYLYPRNVDYEECVSNIKAWNGID